MDTYLDQLDLAGIPWLAAMWDIMPRPPTGMPTKGFSAFVHAGGQVNLGVCNMSDTRI
jgi:hypothetical protein